jgi:hypothetical protein
VGVSLAVDLPAVRCPLLALEERTAEADDDAEELQPTKTILFGRSCN